MMLVLKKATLSDVDECLLLLSEARSFQRKFGFTQWEDGYPSREIVLGDVKSGNARTIMLGGELVGYVSVGNYDEAYDNLVGKWSGKCDYVVAHRLALRADCRGEGLAKEVIRLIQSEAATVGVRYMRVDTHESNAIMNNLLRKLGFSFCGTVLMRGSKRLAYDKFF